MLAEVVQERLVDVAGALLERLLKALEKDLGRKTSSDIHIVLGVLPEFLHVVELFLQFLETTNKNGFVGMQFTKFLCVFGLSLRACVVVVNLADFVQAFESLYVGNSINGSTLGVIDLLVVACEQSLQMTLGCCYNTKIVQVCRYEAAPICSATCFPHVGTFTSQAVAHSLADLLCCWWRWFAGFAQQLDVFADA